MRAAYVELMMDRTANLLGAVGLAVTDQLGDVAHEVLGRTGETPAALIVIGYGPGLSNEQLRRILGLSHPGAVRLVDRLVSDGFVERRSGQDKRAIALHLTPRGAAAREKLLETRIAGLRPLLVSLDEGEQKMFAALLSKLLLSLGTTRLKRHALCRMCDTRVCTNCPIPADAIDADRPAKC